MAAILGTYEYRDGPGQVPWHSRSVFLGWAAGVRMSVGCGSPRPLAVRASRPPRISKPDRRGEFSTAVATLFGNPAQEKRRRWPFPWKIFSLDFQSLMSVRLEYLRCPRFCAPFEKNWLHSEQGDSAGQLQIPPPQAPGSFSLRSSVPRWAPGAAAAASAPASTGPRPGACHAPRRNACTSPCT